VSSFGVASSCDFSGRIKRLQLVVRQEGFKGAAVQGKVSKYGVGGSYDLACSGGCSLQLGRHVSRTRSSSRKRERVHLWQGTRQLHDRLACTTGQSYLQRSLAFLTFVAKPCPTYLMTLSKISRLDLCGHEWLRCPAAPVCLSDVALDDCDSSVFCMRQKAHLNAPSDDALVAACFCF
jgi:hypothetical protein